MAHPSPALLGLLSSQSKDGSKPPSWQRVRACLASKECQCCGKVFRPWVSPSGRWVKEKLWARQRFCSISCSKRLENPMRQVAAARAMRETLKRIRHAPIRRGGNGRLLPLAHLALLHALGPGWAAEHVVTTGIAPGNGIPRHYKLDIANQETMTAIEVDGATHTPQVIHEADMRKTMFLVSHGWSVFHVSNTRAMFLYSTFTSVDTLLTSLMGFSSTTATSSRTLATACIARSSPTCG